MSDSPSAVGRVHPPHPPPPLDVEVLGGRVHPPLPPLDVGVLGGRVKELGTLGGRV